jgi:hypothetical protein
MEYLKRMAGLEVANGTPQTFIGVGALVLALWVVVRAVKRVIGRPVST